MTKTFFSDFRLELNVKLDEANSLKERFEEPTRQEFGQGHKDVESLTQVLCTKLTSTSTLSFTSAIEQK